MSDTTQEIRKEKLQRIEETEKKITDYKGVYNVIKEGFISKLTKNSAIGVFKLIIYILALLFIVDAFYALVADMNDLNAPMGRGYFFFVGLFMAGLFIIIGKALKSNIEKRNVIFKLSKLMEDVITYMDGSLKNEKERYEHFIDEQIKEKKSE